MSNLLLVIAALLSWPSRSEVDRAPSTGRAAKLESGLVDEENRPVAMKNWSERYFFVSFVYTRCPVKEMCPLTMRLNKDLHREWKAQGGKPSLRLVVVTLDPDEDTPQELKKFAKLHKLPAEGVSLVTGPKEKVYDLASAFAVVTIPGENAMGHTVRSFLVDSNWETIEEYPDNKWTGRKVLERILAWEARRPTSARR